MDDANTLVYYIGGTKDPWKSIKANNAQNDNNAIVPNASRINFQLSHRRKTVQISVTNINICARINSNEKEAETVNPNTLSKCR